MQFAKNWIIFEVACVSPAEDYRMKIQIAHELFFIKEQIHYFMSAKHTERIFLINLKQHKTFEQDSSDWTDRDFYVDSYINGLYKHTQMDYHKQYYLNWLATYFLFAI